MKRIKDILILGLTFTVMMIALESYIKWAFVMSVSHSDYDETIGRIRRPNMRYVWNTEGLGVREYNSFGYLGPSYGKEKKDNTIRVALIGDSFVEGFQVFERNHFRSVLERTLQSYFPDKTIEVLNFGRSGFNVCKMYCYQQDFASQFSPDLYVYLIANEDYVEFSSDPVLPTCNIVNDSLVLDYSFRESPYVQKYNRFKFLTQNFASLQIARNCFALIQRGKLHKILLDISYKANYQGIPELNDSTVQYYANLTSMLFDRLDPQRTMIFNRSEDSLIFEPIRDYYDQKSFVLHDIEDTISVLVNSGIETRTWYSKHWNSETKGLRGHWNYESHNTIGIYLAKKIRRFIKRNGIVTEENSSP
ncbi:MAG: SGNH/GDSL hydrolase family protein [Chitinophagales bacterium]|nr:SGNH/GDSL hydrolase family protein [Chitinophagales bacterium]